MAVKSEVRKAAEAAYIEVRGEVPTNIVWVDKSPKGHRIKFAFDIPTSVQDIIALRRAFQAQFPNNKTYVRHVEPRTLYGIGGMAFKVFYNKGESNVTCTV